jgi:hypothetical protein
MSLNLRIEVSRRSRPIFGELLRSDHRAQQSRDPAREALAAAVALIRAGGLKA